MPRAGFRRGLRGDGAAVARRGRWEEEDDWWGRLVSDVASGAVRAERGVAARWADWVAGPVVSGMRRRGTHERALSARGWATRHVELGQARCAGLGREWAGEGWAGFGFLIGFLFYFSFSISNSYKV